MRQKSRALSSVRAAIIAAVAGQLLSAAAWGQQPIKKVVEDEHEDMPPGIPAKKTSPPGGGHTDNLLTQVNVNAQGMNIVGDAANEPSLVVDPTAPNRMAISWRQFDTIASNFRQAGRAWTNDGGRTWHNPGVLDPGVFRSDPCVDSGAEGNLCLVDLTTDLLSWAFTSPDHGQTWINPVNNFGADKEWMTIDRSPSTGHGFIYESWQVQGPYGNMQFTRSTDGGHTWMTPMALPGPPIFGTLAVGPDGELYIAGMNPNTGAVTVDKSTDARIAGNTPTFNTHVVSMGGSFSLPNGIGDPNPAGLEGVIWIDVDRSTGPRRGWVYMVTTLHTVSADPEDIMFVRSTDGGQTWSTPVRINNDAQAANHYQWFGTMSVSPSNGRIDVVWNDTRESLAYNLSRLYYAYSNDGGITWLGNTPQSPQWNSIIGWPQQNKIGDYYHMRSDSVGASLAFAATLNNEQDVYFLRLNDYDCNGNGIPDMTDLNNGTLHDCNGNGIPDECEIAAGVSVPCFHPCYANCDGSTAAPFLNVNDFVCFQNRFAAGDTYANCDHSTTPPVLNVNDFVCFQSQFAAGCSAP